MASCGAKNEQKKKRYRRASQPRRGTRGEGRGAAGVEAWDIFVSLASIVLRGCDIILENQETVFRRRLRVLTCSSIVDRPGCLDSLCGTPKAKKYHEGLELNVVGAKFKITADGHII